MNAADYVIIGVLVISLVLGTIRGFMREAIGLLAWLGGLWLAWRYAHLVTPALGGLLADEPLRTWVARAIILLSVMLFAWIFAGILSYFIHQSGLSVTVDRLLGGLFGLLRGAALVALVTLVAQVVQLHQMNWWKKSQLLPYAVTVADWISGFAESAVDPDDSSVKTRSKREA
ncbi:MAG: CvpA family protein [Candidatus Obscuribacterales bacterium]|nr:CvpA family protein [Steroidobacteraceae bacterium]